MYSREDVVKTLLAKKGVDPFATGGVRNRKLFSTFLFSEASAKLAQTAFTGIES